jgi:hypothetical protein
VRRPELAGLSLPPTDAGEDHRVHLADEPRAQRQLLQPLESDLHGSDVVDDLLDVRPEWLLAGLCIEDIDERSLGSLDAGGCHRLPTEVGPYEEVRVGEQASCAGQPTQSRLGISDPHEVVARDR